MLAIYATAWLAISCWACANWLRTPCLQRAARVVWSIGGVALLAHGLLALHIVHSWDHEDAYRAVAAATYAQTGLDWGGGLYINHAFSALWLVDAATWWLAPRRYERRSRWLDGAIQFLFLFIFVNATIIFGADHARVLGALLCPLGALGWWCSQFIHSSSTDFTDDTD